MLPVLLWTVESLAQEVGRNDWGWGWGLDTMLGPHLIGGWDPDSGETRGCPWGVLNPLHCPSHSQGSGGPEQVGNGPGHAVSRWWHWALEH